jgi:hypothetical protein
MCVTYTSPGVAANPDGRNGPASSSRGDPPSFVSPFRERTAYFRDRGLRETTQAVSAALLCYMCTALRHALSEWQNNDTASLAPMASRTNIANACIYATAAKRPYAI